MATPSVRGQYVDLTVRVWYDKGNKQVMLTSNDPDLPSAGFIVDLPPGSQADRSARALLAKFGKL